MQSMQVEDSGDATHAGQASVDKCYQMLEKSYDPEMGGFSSAPKFPQPGEKNNTIARIVFLCRVSYLFFLFTYTAFIFLHHHLFMSF